MTIALSLSASAPASLVLSFDLAFADLYRRDGLIRLDQLFMDRLTEAAPSLADRLREARANPQSIELKHESELLIALAPHLEEFIAELFGIEQALSRLAARHHELTPLYACKRLFVQRKA